MKTASANEIKASLKDLDQKELVELCLRLARFKKENKELLTFLLYEADDIDLYVKHVKEELAVMFVEVNTRQVYLAKKSIRKILRLARKYIRYSGSKTAEVEILIFFLNYMAQLDLPLKRYPVLMNIYQGQLKKLNAAIAALHEDLQYDYLRQIETLE